MVLFYFFEDYGSHLSVDGNFMDEAGDAIISKSFRPIKSLSFMIFRGTTHFLVAVLFVCG